MSAEMERTPGRGVAGDAFDRLDRMFAEWARAFPMFPQLAAAGQRRADDVIRVDEYRENGTLVIEAEMPGIDPERDARVSVSGGMLHIEAERHMERRTEERGYIRQERAEGTFGRTLPLPEGVTEKDVSATYKDGVLRVLVPVPEHPRSERIPITKG